MADRRDLTDGPVAGHLTRLGAPMILGIVGVMSVSLVDTCYLGQLGTEPLAAISFTFPVVLTISSLAIGLSAGTSSVVARSIGEGDAPGTRRSATDGMLLAFGFVTVASIAGWLLVRPLFSLLGADGQVLDLIVQYMQIWFIGMPFLVVPMVANGLIRANGDSVAPSALMLLAAVVNLVLDPLLIFGLGPFPELGIEGAAWSSLAARACTFVAGLALVIFREKLLTAEIPAMSELWTSWRRVLSVGVPAAGSNMINPLGITAATALLASYGDEVVASFGVATRVQAFVAIPLLALSAAIGPIAGQNWGDQQEDRTRQVTWQAFGFSLAWSVLAGVLFWTLSEVIAAPFSDDAEVVRRAADFLRLVGWSVGGYGVVIIAAATCNAIDKAVVGLGFNLLRSAVLYVPLLGLGVLLGPPWVAFAGIALANVVSGVSVAVAMRWVARR